MKLFIAEKPSLGRAIADVLPKPHKKNDGFIEAANGDVVTWCIGHLLEQAPPEDYDPKYKKWLEEHLPIVPNQWQLKPKAKTRKQLSTIKRLIKKAQIIVNAGDVDREGQILVDEAIKYCGASQTKINNAQRCLVSDMNFAAVQKAVNNLKPNQEFLPLAVSALSRARADWLYGLNMTRLCTLQGKKSGYNGVLSIGRVQTPILGLVVNRDIEIENFISKPFYQVIAHLQTEQGENFQAKWQPSDACQPYMDEEKRIVVKALAENVVNRINGKQGEVSDVKSQNKQNAVPLPFSLSGLQIAASKAFGMSAKQVLDVCQQLYEKHKLITYPRSDCQYLPTEHLSDVTKVTAALANIDSKLATFINQADLKKKSRAWNNSKVGAHHAIIPTAKSTVSGSLTKDEQNIYYLVARQYLAQFFQPFTYAEKTVIANIAGGTFISKQKDVIAQGWKVLFPKSTKANSPSDEFSKPPLPNLSKGQSLLCEHGELLEKNTTPPKCFTDATLLAALTGIARYVSDPEIKKALRETDGLGTEATRAGIIELLFKRQFLKRSGKEIRATEVGRKLITALPKQISQPDMTALWESQLESISQQQLNYQRFISGIEQNLNSLIEQVKGVAFNDLPKIDNKRKFAFKKRAKRKPKSTAA